LSEPLPPELEPIAWSEDSVLMALRHRWRPFWGVQFHPESILTEYGSRLLANFGQIVASHQKRSGVAAGKRLYTAHTREIRVRADSAVVYSALFGRSRHTAWLDSVRTDLSVARFSYLVEASTQLGEILTYRLTERKVFIEEVGGAIRSIPGSIFDVLDKEVDRRVINAPQLPFDLVGGFVGYFGYELKAECGAAAAHTSELPDAVWIRPPCAGWTRPR
jgi:para-aminobenzoate synthetase